MIQDWKATVMPAENGQQMFMAIDFEKYLFLKIKYADLPQEKKLRYKNPYDYIERHGGARIGTLEKNYILLMEETKEQLESEDVLDVFTIDTLDHDVEILDLLSSLEEETHIKEVYRRKKLRVKKTGISTKDTHMVIDCIRQGRSLLQAGLKAEMLAKPLIDFYAASAYAYAIIVLNSPLHKSLDSLKGSHGHTYNHHNKTIDFGGDIPSGTFLDLLCALSIANVSQNNGQPISIRYSILSSIEMVQKNKISISLIPLLSMVPELSGHFMKMDPEHSSVYKIRIDTGVHNTKTTYNFYIGDGTRKPIKNNLVYAFKTENVIEEQGSYKVAVESEKISTICPQIYQDMYGELWYVESPIKELYLPELCLHFLIISALCNIMRYSPHEWSDILSNRTSSQFSLVINQYVRIFERKFPLLVTQYLSHYNPIIKNR